MKSLAIIVGLACLMFTASCSRDRLWLLSEEDGNVVINTSSDNESAQIPSSIQTYISTHYASAILSVEIDDEMYQVLLSDGSELFFDLTGAFVNETQVSGGDLPISSVPASALTYINTNYPTDPIDEVRQRSNGSYEVRLISHIRLIFSTEWQFLYAEFDNDIPVSALPQSILDYVAATYPGESITEAEEEQSGLYEIKLSNGVELYFDGTGSLLYQENQQGEWWENDDNTDTQIPISQLPDAISAYLQTNYPNALIVKAEIEANGNYEVRLSNGLKLYFNADGNFLYLESEFQLSISSLSLPDTVTIGDTVLLNGYILNSAPIGFQGNELEVVFGIEDTPPVNLMTAAEDGAENIGTTTIAAQDSVAFSVPVAVTAARFNVGFDIAVVWPDVPTSINPVIVGGGRNAVQTFVKLP